MIKSGIGTNLSISLFIFFFIFFTSFTLICQTFCYLPGATNATIPTIINIGNAIDIRPPITIPIRINGRNTTVSNSFDIPQAALTPKINNFPNIQIIHMVNNNDNIFFSFCRLSLRLFISFCSRVLST